MEWLNYHHLHYFWVVAREGSIARASRALRLAEPTISEQLRGLEASLGEKLFAREGRALSLTEVGRVVFGYADEIFSLGKEMQETLKGKPSGRPQRLVVGVADVVPKLIAFQLLEPALRLPEPVQIVVREDKPERLIESLSAHALDLVLSDAPLTPPEGKRAYNHLLGESPIAVFGAEGLAIPARARFPQSLAGAPFLLPLPDTALRRSLDQWFEERKIHPRIVGEFQDTALLEVFAEAGAGLFAAPAAAEGELKRRRELVFVGRLDPLCDRFYAVSVERRLKNPAAVAISDGARQRLFRSEGPSRA